MNDSSKLKADDLRIKTNAPNPGNKQAAWVGIGFVLFFCFFVAYAVYTNKTP